MLLPWRKMWDFISWCGEAHDLHQMLCNAVQELPRIVPCENAFACRAQLLAGGRMSVYLEHNGIPAGVARTYCDHYFYEDIVHAYMDRDSPTYAMDWTPSRLGSNGFVQDFIRGMMHVDFSAGIPVFDPDGTGGVNLGFTRVGMTRTTKREEAILLALRAPLVNLLAAMKRLESMPADHFLAAELESVRHLLSRREAEVVGYLCRRVGAREIASLLGVSKRTVDTHVQHIYYKLSVNSRAELLRRLMG